MKVTYFYLLELMSVYVSSESPEYLIIQHLSSPMCARWNSAVNGLRCKCTHNVAARGTKLTVYMLQIRVEDVQIIACAVLRITWPIFYLTTIVITFWPLL